MADTQTQRRLCELISGGRQSFDETIEGLVGSGTYQLNHSPREYLHLMSTTTLCGLNSHSLVEWNGKLILFCGELHGNARPCPVTTKASNFFQSMMHLFTECPQVALLYEGHKHMLRKDPSIIERMIKKGYPFKALSDPEAIIRYRDYLNVIRTIDVVLLYQPRGTNKRVDSLRSRLHAFDIREDRGMVSPWSSHKVTSESIRQSLDSARRFMKTIRNVNTAAFEQRAQQCTGSSCYRDLFIETPDYLAASLIKSVPQKYVIVYGGAFHTEAVPKLLPGARVLRTASCRSGEGSCSVPT